MKLSTSPLACAAGLALSWPGAAQPALTELHDTTLPLDGQRARVLASGDFDRNGQTDLIVAGRSATGQLPVVCLMNVGGVLREESFRIPTPLGAVAAFAVGDVDADGDLDVLVGINRGKDLLWRNDGTGTFRDETAGNLDIDGGATGDLALADLDRDGDLDVLIGSQWTVSTFSRIALNDGTGRFTDAPSPRLPDLASHLTPGDYDGDGDVDLLLVALAATRTTTELRLLLNAGNATFTDATARLPAGSSFWSRLRPCDVDGDGDLDLVFATQRLGTNPGGLRLWLNDGRANFSDATSQRLPPSAENVTELVVLDVDGDRDLDLVAAAAPWTGFLDGGRDQVLVNDGRGTFADRTAALGWEDAGVPMHGAGVLDLEADGDLDLVFGSAIERLVAYANLGDGRCRWLNPRSFPPDGATSYATAAGDLDGDGDVDVVQLAGGADRLWLGDGYGRWTDASAGRLPEQRREGDAVALADVDGDGDLDVLTSDVALYLNDGSARFTDASSGRLPAQDVFVTKAITAADFDGDGDLDVVLAKQHAPNVFWENDGTGRFTDTSAARLGTQPADPTWCVASGDIDGDGDRDLVFGNYDPGVKTGGFAQVWRNVGGTFRADPAALPILFRNTTAVVLADFDHDGDLDLFQAALAWCHNPRPDDSRLYRNDGSGRFTDVTGSAFPSIDQETQAAAVADLDGDGDLDLVLGHAIAILGCGGQNPQDLVLENDGAGNFTDATSLFVPDDNRLAEHVLATDFDGDGDQDLLVTNGDHGTGSPDFAADSLLFNLRQHLDTPNGALLGGTYDVDLYAHRLASPGSRFAVLLLGFDPVRLPLPGLGILRVDPATAAVAPPLPLPRLGGRRLSFALPRQRALLGVPVYAQALIVDANAPPSAWRLTPAARDAMR